MAIPSIRLQATLQRRILFALVEESSPSVVSLAARLNASRPAVSRALAVLERNGLVQKTSTRAWEATSTGSAALQELRSETNRTVSRAMQRRNEMDRTFGQIATTDARSLVEAMIGTAGPPSVAAETMRAVNASLLGPNSAVFDSLRGYVSAQQSIGSSLATQVGALQGTNQWWTSMLADNLSVMGRAAADIAAVTASLGSPDRVLKRTEIRVGMALESVARANHRQLLSAIDTLRDSEPTSRVSSFLVAPAATTAAFTGSARTLISGSTGREDTQLRIEAAVGELSARLEVIGAPSAARDLRAAWLVYERRSPGWGKTGPHLLREVIRELLDELAPPKDLPRDDRGEVTKRTQVASIVGGSRTLVEFVDVTSTSVRALHTVLSAEAKHLGEPRVGPEGLLGLLEVTMGLARILLEGASMRRRD